MGNGVVKKEKQKSLLYQSLEDHDASINCMALSEDHSVLATGSDDKTIRLWSTKTDSVECIGILEGHDDYITTVLIVDNYLISGSFDKTIRKWDMSSSECVLVYEGHTSTINKVIPAGDFIFSISYDKSARCWDIDTGQCVRVFLGHKSNVVAIVFLPADKENLNDALNFLKKNKNFKKKALLNASDHKQREINLKKLNLNQEEDEEKQNDDDDDDDNMYNKDIIITGSLDSTAKSWSFETGECIHTFKGHSAAVTCLATDTAGKILFTGSSDHTIRSWNIAKGEAIKVFEGHQTTVISLIAHKKLLYSASSDHTARCWVMEFGDCTRVYKGHTHTVGAMHVENGIIFTGCGDGIARCFDTKSGTLLQTFKHHSGAINCMKLVGMRLFTGSFDSNLDIWDLNSLLADQQPVPNETSSSKNIKKSMNEESLRIENEINYNLRLPTRNQPAPKAPDQRSEVDSGIDEREFSGRTSGNKLKKPKHINVREIV